MSESKKGSETKSPAKKPRKGERPGFDKTVAINLYPEEHDVPKALDNPEEATFSVKRNESISARDKTNIMEITIPKLEQLSDNAEAYCRLLSRLYNDKWSRTESSTLSQLFFMKARDFADCIHTQCSYSWNSAVGEFLRGTADRMERNMAQQGKSEVWAFSADDVRYGTLTTLRKLFEKHAQSISLATYGTRDDDLAIKALERYFWGVVEKAVFREPHRAYEVQLDYLKHDVRKPYSEDFVKFKTRLEEVFSYLTKFPARSLRGEMPNTEAYDERDKPIQRYEIREALFNALPKTWRDEFERRINMDVRKVPEETFMNIMLKIEEEDKAKRPLLETSRSTGKRSRSNDNSSGSPKKKSRGNKFCNKCKDAGRSEAAYKSHNESDCKYDSTRAKTDNRSGKRSEVNQKRKPDFQVLQKQIMTMSKQLTKLTRKKRRRSESSDSSSDSSSSSS